jgi:hypothetical protein
VLSTLELVTCLRKKFFGGTLVREVEEKVKLIWENLKIEQMRQKSYHYKGKATRLYEAG